MLHVATMHCSSSVHVLKHAGLLLRQDPKTEEMHDVVIKADDGVRAGTSAASLAKLRAVFKKDGSTTAGNSSQVHPPL